MRIWTIEDHYHTFPQMAFETKEAADHYIQANQLNAHPVALTVYSYREVKELWPVDGGPTT